MISSYSNIILLCSGLMLAFFLCSCGPGPQEDTENPASEVRTRETAFAKTMADRDFDAFLDFISPEAIFFSGNKPNRGHDAISAAWAKYYEGETAPFSWHPEVIEVLESGSLALSSGPVYSSSGEIIGSFNSIWRKDKDGQWRVVFDKGS